MHPTLSATLAPRALDGASRSVRVARLTRVSGARLTGRTPVRGVPARTRAGATVATEDTD